MANTFHSLKLRELIDETSKAKSLVFEVPTDLQEEFQYQAGQYLTLRFEIDGEEFRRSYSLSSAPHENSLRVCVKRVQQGKVSNYICDNLSVGQDVEVMAPEGRFKFKPNPERQAQYYLFAAGSGITPIIAIAKEILEEEPLSSVYLLYGNLDETEVIYMDELNSLVNKYNGQFHMKHAYSNKEAKKKGVLGGLFKKSTIELPFFPGQISKNTIKKFLGIYSIQNPQKVSAYICGPGSMNEDTKEILVKSSFLKNQVHFESFGTIGADPEVEGASGEQVDVTVHLDSEAISLHMDRSQTVLEALLEAGYDPPHSCSSGACSSCMAKLEEGKVTMDVTHALDEDDIEDGYILTCQARVDANKIVIKYE